MLNANAVYDMKIKLGESLAPLWQPSSGALMVKDLLGSIMNTAYC